MNYELHPSLLRTPSRALNYGELKMSDKELLFECPECGSQEVAVTVEQKFMVNTGDHYCHSVKAHDSNAKVTCLECRWTGQRDQLKRHN